MVKLKAIVPVNLGPAKVYRIESQSRLGLFHYVLVFQNENGVRCTCEGWQWQGHCWHVDSIPLPKEDP